MLRITSHSQYRLSGAPSKYYFICTSRSVCFPAIEVPMGQTGSHCYPISKWTKINARSVLCRGCWSGLSFCFCFYYSGCRRGGFLYEPANPPRKIVVRDTSSPVCGPSLSMSPSPPDKRKTREVSRRRRRSPARLRLSSRERTHNLPLL